MRDIELIAGNTFYFACALYERVGGEIVPINIDEFENFLIAIYWGGTKKAFIKKEDCEINENKINFILNGETTKTMFGKCKIEAKLITDMGSEVNGQFPCNFTVKNLNISQE